MATLLKRIQSNPEHSGVERVELEDVQGWIDLRIRERDHKRQTEPTFDAPLKTNSHGVSHESPQGMQATMRALVRACSWSVRIAVPPIGTSPHPNFLGNSQDSPPYCVQKWSGFVICHRT